MPKSKKEKAPPSDDQIMKALDELEEIALEKGDAMFDADPEGGLSTEGKPLSDKAPSGKGEAVKAMGGSSASSSSSASDSSSEKAPPKKMKKAAGGKMKKQMPSMAYSSSASESADDKESESAAGRESASDESSSMDKSFRQVADEDETMAKAMEVSEFIEAMVDQLSASHGDLSKSVAGLRAHVDDRVAKSQAAQGDFNRRMAHAVVSLGKQQGEILDLLKSISNQPAVAPRGKALLSKAEVNQPPFAGGGQADQGGDVDVADLSQVPSEKICDWLFNKAMENKVPHLLISEFESSRYNPEVLPAQIRKALANDLCK